MSPLHHTFPAPLLRDTGDLVPPMVGENSPSCRSHKRCGTGNHLYYPPPPPPPGASYTRVQATLGVGAELFWDLISFGIECSAATNYVNLVMNLNPHSSDFGDGYRNGHKRLVGCGVCNAFRGDRIISSVSISEKKNNPKIFDYLWKHFSFIGAKGTGSMFYHQNENLLQSFITKNSALCLWMGVGIPRRPSAPRHRANAEMQWMDVWVVWVESLSAKLP